MSTDREEYATGNPPNPFDLPADVPRDKNWQERFLEGREKQLEGQPWYPLAVAPPPTVIPRRYRAFEADEGAFQASISPQRWDSTGNVAVPVNDGAHGNPIEIVPFLPGRAHLEIINVGANPIILSPTIQEALNGRGITLAAGATKAFDTQAGFWVWATGGASTVQAWWTFYESPTSHVPPKDKEGS